MASCTVIKAGSTVSKTSSERVEELKNKINNIQIPVIVANVGDIAFYDNTENKVIIVSFDKWNNNKNNYLISRYTPIGIVVVPANHDVYGTGECGVMSLLSMSNETPDDGAVQETSLYWGYDNKLLGKVFNECVTTGTMGEPTIEASGVSSNAVYPPSDKYANNSSPTQCPTDPDAFYSSNDSNTAGPSAFLTGGSRNPVYYQTESPSSDANCLSDFDGIGNTKLILDNVTVENWKTAETIANNYNEGNYPAAMCCWRFHTPGTQQGDWYLPAMGELCYAHIRRQKIEDVINTIITAYGEIISPALSSTYYWSSTEYSADSARRLDLYRGFVYGYSKDFSYYVRAFLRVSGSLS